MREVVGKARLKEVKRSGGLEMYILLSLLPPLPEIFCVRRAPNSVLRSTSCFLRSSLDFDRSWEALTFTDDCIATQISRHSYEWVQIGDECLPW